MSHGRTPVRGPCHTPNASTVQTLEGFVTQPMLAPPCLTCSRPRTTSCASAASSTAGSQYHPSVTSTRMPSAAPVQPDSCSATGGPEAEVKSAARGGTEWVMAMNRLRVQEHRESDTGKQGLPDPVTPWQAADSHRYVV